MMNGAELNQAFRYYPFSDPFFRTRLLIQQWPRKEYPVILDTALFSDGGVDVLVYSKCQQMEN